MSYVRLDSLDNIKKKLGIDINGRVQKYLQDTAYRYMDKYVPYKDDNLRRIVVLSDPTKIVYDVEYAEYQYEGQRKDGSHVITNHTTAGTYTHWDKEMMNAEGDDLVKEVQRFVNRGGK